MYEFVKPLSPYKCITIRMYLSATNKATTDKTLQVGKELIRVVRDCLWETYHTKEQNQSWLNHIYTIFTNDHDGSQSLQNMNVLRDKIGTFFPSHNINLVAIKNVQNLIVQLVFIIKQIQPEKCAENVCLAYVRKENLLKIWFDCFVL